MRKLLSLFKASPTFIDVLRAFGQKTSFDGDSHIHFANGTSTGSIEGEDCFFQTIEIIRHA